MLKRVGFVSLWVVATLVATTVALAAVRSVAGQVVDSPGSELLAASPGTTTVRETPTLPSTDTSSTTSLARADATKPSDNNGETSTQSKALPAPTSPDAAPATTETPTAEAPSTPPPTTAPPPASSVPPTTVADDGDDDDEDDEDDEGDAPAATDVKTYQLVGGWVRIASSPGVVTLDGAGPNPGFTMNIDSSGPESVDVDFRSDDHRSDFEAEWSDGELEVDTEEKVED